MQIFSAFVDNFNSIGTFTSFGLAWIKPIATSHEAFWAKCDMSSVCTVWSMIKEILYISHWLPGNPCKIYVAPYSRHFFNETHENDPAWALFPIAVSDDPSSTQVCKQILSILSFLEVLSSIMPVFAWLFVLPLNILASFWNPALTLASFAHFFVLSCLD